MAVSGGTAASAANPSGRDLVVAAVLLNKLLFADRGLPAGEAPLTPLRSGTWFGLCPLREAAQEAPLARRSGDGQDTAAAGSV